jgi:hypothetical protein
MVALRGGLGSHGFGSAGFQVGGWGAFLGGFWHGRNL